MRTIKVNVTTEEGVVLDSTTVQVPDSTRTLEIVDAEPFEGDYRPLGELDIGAPGDQDGQGSQGGA